MQKTKPTSPNKPVHRITYQRSSGAEVIVAPRTALGTSRSPIRQSKSAISPLRESSVELQSGFLSSLTLAEQNTFAQRIEGGQWTEDGQQIRDQVIDHSVDVNDSRIQRDLRASSKLADLLQLIKTLEECDFDPVFTGADAESVFRKMNEDEAAISRAVEPPGEAQFGSEGVDFAQPQDFELYALSFDAIIDHLKAGGEDKLTETLEQLKQYFLQRLKATPTRMRALENATEALDAQLLLEQRDNAILTQRLNNQTMDYAMQEQRYDRLEAQIVRLQCVISELEAEREGMRMEVGTKSEHIKVLGREIQNTQSLLSDALARCKRLSNASQKLKIEAERANERYNDAERAIAVEQRKSLEIEYEKTDFEHEATRYKKEYEKLKDLYKEEQDRNAVEYCRLNAKMTQLSENTGMSFSFKSENLGKTCQEACQTLVKLSRFSDAELEAVQLDRDGIAALAYILDSADSSETIEKFLFAVKTDFKPGINKQSETMINWQSLDANPAQAAYKNKISQQLSQLKQEENVQQGVTRTQTEINTRRDQILAQQTKLQNSKDTEAEYEPQESESGQETGQEEEPEDDVQVAMRKEAGYPFPPPVPYEKAKPELLAASDGQPYTKEEIRERKRELFAEEEELKKMMMEAIEKQKAETGKQDGMSLLDVLEKHTNEARMEETDSDISENDVIIRPDEFLMMNEDQQLQYIQKFNDYTRERQRRLEDESNLLKSTAESHFNYRNETDFFDNSSGDETDLGTGFLNTMFSSEVLRRKLGKASSILNSGASATNSTPQIRELAQLQKIGNYADRSESGESLQEKQLPALTRTQANLSQRGSNFGSSTTKRSSSGGEYMRPASEQAMFRVNGKLCSDASMQTEEPSIDALLTSITERIERKNSTQRQDDVVLEQIGLFIQEHPKLSPRELKTLTQVANSYIVHRAQAKQRGWEAPATIETLENAVKAELFEDQCEAQQIVQQQLAEDEQLERIHQIIKQRVADQDSLIDPEEFLETNSLFIAQESQSEQGVLLEEREERQFSQDELEQQLLSYEEKVLLPNLSEEQIEIVEREQAFLTSEKEEYEIGTTLDYHEIEQFAKETVEVFDHKTNRMGEVSIADVIVPGYEHQQHLLRGVISVLGGVDSKYKHISSNDAEKTRSLIIKRRADVSLIASIRDELRREGYDERLLERRAEEIANQRADNMAAVEVERQLIAQGSTPEEAKSQATELVRHTIREISQEAAVEALPTGEKSEKPHSGIVGMPERIEEVEEAEEAVETIQTSGLVHETDLYQDIELIDAEVQNIEDRFAEQAQRIKELQLSATGHTDIHEREQGVGEQDVSNAEVFVVPAAPRLSDISEEEQVTEENIQIQAKTANIVKHLKNSLYKDEKVGGVVSSLAKAHAISQSQEQSRAQPRKSIISLYEPKETKTTAALEDLEDLEEAFADAKDDETAEYLQHRETIEQQAEAAVGQFVNPNLRREVMASVPPEVEQAENESRFDEFLRFINKKTFDDRYNLPPNAMIEHPINGKCENYYIEVRELFGEQYFEIQDEEASLRAEYGLEQAVTIFNFYPCLLKRGQFTAEWLEDERVGNVSGLLGTTYQHYLDRKEVIFEKSGPKSELCAPTLLPLTGDVIDYIRSDSLSLFGNSPRILDLLENYAQVVFQRVKARDTNYIKVPLFNNQLKSLEWTLRTVRMLLYEREFSSLELLVIEKEEKRVMETEIEEEREDDRLRLVPGELSQEEAFSLADFVFSYAITRYGLKTLVLQLLSALITSLSYYQHINSELFIFARFFFDDLPSDFLLLYLELRKLTKIDVLGDKSSLNSLAELTFDADYAPGLANALFPNWDARRKFVLAEELLQFSESTETGSDTVFESPVKRGTASTGPEKAEIKLSKAAALILSQFSVFRAVTFRNCQFLVEHFASSTSEEQDVVQLSAWKQLFDCIGVEVDAREFFLAFKKPPRITNFDEFFEKYELGRFACISPAVLRGRLDGVLVQQAAKISQLGKTLELCFKLVGKHSRNKLAKLSGEQPKVKEFLQQRFDLIQSWFKVVESDIRVFDCERSLRGLQKIGQEMVQCLNWEGESYDIEIAVVETLAEIVKEFVGY